MTPEQGTILARLAVALLAGLLIGLDRERAEQRKARDIFGGVRTFPLIALTGCVSAVMFETAGPWLAVVAFLAVSAIVVIAYRTSAAEGHVGATTEVAGIATFLVGVLAGTGDLLVAGAAGIVVAALLVAKPKLEAISRAMTPEEVAAVLELAVISGIILPILPDRGYGPWNALNPREIWLVVVFVTGLSFAGFVAARLLGEKRGLAVTGVLGGMVSSTAVTVAMADLSKKKEALPEPAAAAVVLASSVMAIRVAIFAGVIDPGVVSRLAPACLAMAVTGAVAARLIARGDRTAKTEAGEKLRNPFSVRQAVVFAVIYAAIVLAVRATQEYMGSGATFAAAVVGSVADVDAVTIALTRAGPGPSGWRTIAAAITLAAVVNTVVKLVIAWIRGSRPFALRCASALGAMALAGAAAGAALYLRG